MLDIQKIRNSEPKILIIGSYSLITQSILDFDFLSGKARPSIEGIIRANKKGERFFYGEREVLIPYYKNLIETGQHFNKGINFFLNVASARRVLYTTNITLSTLPNLICGNIFAENTPEKHSLELHKFAQEKNVPIIGPSSVGLLVPGKLKLGAIGGVETRQLLNPIFYEKGSIAGFSASGGMTNEILNIFSSFNKRVSFMLSFGGDRFPITTPSQAFLEAERDPETSHIVYFGELGGSDEYELAKLIENGQVKKPVISYIAGSIADYFPTSPQFGHAKAMAKEKAEKASEKTKELKRVGVKTANSFTEFVKLIKAVPQKTKNTFMTTNSENLTKRRRALFATTITKETDSEVFILDEDQLELSRKYSFSYITISLLLGKKIKSRELEEFTDLIMKLLVDNGPSVSGAANTIITARAGRDMVSALCAGLLSIGKRFGGAVNEAAKNWIMGVESGNTPEEFVENFSKNSEIIEGIGHKKYRVDNPDPRIRELMKWADKLKGKKYLSFAQSVEKVTTNKKANLILNVDGAMSAIILDILVEKEGFDENQLKELVETEFFNALFIIPRSVGFIAHFLDQKRLDEGLFRLPREEVAFIKR